MGTKTKTKGERGKREKEGEVEKVATKNATAAERGTYPTVRGLTQCGISKVLAPSFFADGKSVDESKKIGVMNQSYSWPG